MVSRTQCSQAPLDGILDLRYINLLFKGIQQVCQHWPDVLKFIKEVDQTLTATKKLKCLISSHSIPLEIELASLVEYSKPLVSCCYFLESDGLIILDAYDKLNEVKFHLESNSLHPNIAAVIKKHSLNDLAKKLEFERTIKEKIKNCKEYFTGQLFKHKLSFDICKAARYFSPVKFISMELENILDDLSIFPWMSEDIKKKLHEEISTYKSLCQNLSSQTDIFDWWRLNELKLPTWYYCFEYVSLYLTSSAAAERLGSMFHNKFSDSNQQSLEDYIEISMMMQYNYK